MSLLSLLCLGISGLSAIDYQVHRVKKGDTLYSLSKRYGVTVDNLMKLNKLSSSKLSIGQAIKIKAEANKPISKPKPKVKDTPVPATAAKPKPQTQEPATTQETTVETAQLPIPAPPRRILPRYPSEGKPLSDSPKRQYHLS